MRGEAAREGPLLNKYRSRFPRIGPLWRNVNQQICRGERRPSFAIRVRRYGDAFGESARGRARNSGVNTLADLPYSARWLPWWDAASIGNEMGSQKRQTLLLTIRSSGPPTLIPRRVVRENVAAGIESVWLHTHGDFVKCAVSTCSS